MNRDEHMLRRLLKASKQSRRETPVSIPFVLEARVLAGWRSSVPEKEALISVGIFRSAAICGALIMIASLGWYQWSDVHEVPGAAAFVSLAKNIQIVP